MKYLFSFSLLLLIVSSLSARTVRSVFIQAPRNVGKVALLQPIGENGAVGDPIKLPFATRNLGEGIVLPAGDLTLAVLAKPLADGEELPAKAQIIKVPAAWKNLIILIVPDRKNEIFPGQAFVVNSSDAAFPKGDTMVYNLSNVLFRGKFGPRKIVLKPKKSGVFKAPLDAQGTYIVELDCILPKTTKVRAITRTKWVHNPNARQLLFVVPTEGKVLPRAWTLLDHRKDKEDKEADVAEAEL